MDYDQRARDAYMAGARETLTAALPSLKATDARAVQEWIEIDLAQWTCGAPPASPADWHMPEALGE